MNQCAQCAQEIDQSATMCESCRRAALERLFDEVSLTPRPAPVTPVTVVPAAASPAALFTAGVAESSVTLPSDVSTVSVLENRATPVEITTSAWSDVPQLATGPAPAPIDDLEQPILP